MFPAPARSSIVASMPSWAPGCRRRSNSHLGHPDKPGGYLDLSGRICLEPRASCISVMPWRPCRVRPCRTTPIRSVPEVPAEPRHELSRRAAWQCLHRPDPARCRQSRSPSIRCRGAVCRSAAPEALSDRGVRAGSIASFEASRRAGDQSGLITLAEETGGRAAMSMNDYAQALDGLSDEMLNFYSLAYEPPVPDEVGANHSDRGSHAGQGPERSLPARLCGQEPPPEVLGELAGSSVFWVWLTTPWRQSWQRMRFSTWSQRAR